MKKTRLISLLIVLSLLLTACGTKPADEPVPAPPGTSTQQPQQGVSSSQTGTGSQTGTVTGTGQSGTEPAPSGNTEPEEYDIWTWYRKLEGTWLVTEGEIEGYRYGAEEAGVYALVEFYSGHTAHYIERSTETDSVDEYFYGLEVEEGQLYGSGDEFHLVMDSISTPVKKTVSIDGDRLVMDMEYKGGYGGGTLFFEKLEAPLLARVTEMEAEDYNTNADGSFNFDPNWYDIWESITLLPKDPDDQLYWFLITAEAEELSVQLEANYMGTDFFSMITKADDIFVTSQTCFHTHLKAGQTLAVRASKPESAEYRVCVSSGDFWGSYEFEKLNKFTEPTFSNPDDPGDLVYYAGQMGMVFPITGHSKALEKLTAGGSVAEATRFLEGSWVLLNNDNYIEAVLTADHNGDLQFITNSGVYDLNFYFDRLFASDNDPADLLCFYADDRFKHPQGSLRLSVPGNVGDYYFEVYQTDNEELLYLTQANNGDAVLPFLLGDEMQFTYVFHRYEGTSADVWSPKNKELDVRIVRYDVDNWKLWVQPVKVIDSYEDGSPFWGKTAEPCYPYTPANAEVLTPLFYVTGNYNYPMLNATITVDDTGQVIKLEE